MKEGNEMKGTEERKEEGRGEGGENLRKKEYEVRKEGRKDEGRKEGRKEETMKEGRRKKMMKEEKNRKESEGW